MSPRCFVPERVALRDVTHANENRIGAGDGREGPRRPRRDRGTVVDPDEPLELLTRAEACPRCRGAGSRRHVRVRGDRLEDTGRFGAAPERHGEWTVAGVGHRHIQCGRRGYRGRTVGRCVHRRSVRPRRRHDEPVHPRGVVRQGPVDAAPRGVGRGRPSAPHPGPTARSCPAPKPGRRPSRR